MSMASSDFADSGLTGLDTLLQSLEIENKHQQNEIQKEQQQAAAFEAAITEKENSIKTLQEDTARLDEETKSAHQQFSCNKETYDRLKNHYLALVLNQETSQKELHELQDRWQVKQVEHERILQHYESIWDTYKAKYEEKELAIELRQWQQQTTQTWESLSESQHKVAMLKAAIQEKQDKKKNALKPFKSLNDWIIQLAGVWVSARDLRKEKEDTRHSISDAKKKIQDKKERQLQQQKEQEEQERKRMLKEAEEKKRQEELERQKQQQLYQQQQLQQLKAQQQQQQQQQFQLTVASSPQQIPQSPLQQPVRKAHSQYFQSTIIGHAAPRSTAAAPSTAQQLRQPPYLQMPIMASPRQTVGSTTASSYSTTSFVSPMLTLIKPKDSLNKIQQQPQSAVQQTTDAPTHHEVQALPQSSTHEGAETSRELMTNQRAITRQDEPIKERRDAAKMQPEIDRRTEGGEECGEIHETVENTVTSETHQAPSLEPTNLEDPGIPGLVLSLPPQSPFNLEDHLQSLNEMSKSPGFAYSCRPMFGSQEEMDVNNEVPDKRQSDAPPSSSPSPASENFESPFFQSLFTGMGEVSQPSSHTPTHIFGSGGKPKESSRPTGTSIFGRPDNLMDIGQSRTQEGALSIFGGGQDKADKTRNDEEGSPASGFSFNFSGGPDSPNINSSGEGRFRLF